VITPVGHAYGGFVITNAATGTPNVKALVYIAAFAPAEGDTVQSLTSYAPGSLLGPDTLTIRTFPTPDGQLAPEGYITPSAFRKVFAGDLPKATTGVMATSQRPAALATLNEPSGPPAWVTIPSWYLVGGADQTIGTANLRFMAKRIHATTVEVKGASHVVTMSHPRRTARLIVAAAAPGEARLTRPTTTASSAGVIPPAGGVCMRSDSWPPASSAPTNCSSQRA
jgi:pimeloyl-ACP methyl ester carboxylesterase